MGSLYLTALADWIRAAGVPVVEYDGWKSRSRSSGGFDPGRPWGVMWHHTASQTSPQNDASYMCNGSSDRPIANLLIARDGTVWVLAAGATNTNGKGNAVRWSRGTVPADSMNTYAVGMEIANSGTGEAFPQAQIDSAFAASVAVVRGLGLDPGDVCTHYGYAPTRKIDPAKASVVQGPWVPKSCTSSGTWDLSDLVAEHRRRAAGGTPAPTPPDPDPTPVGGTVSGSSSLWMGNGRLDVFVTGEDDGHLYHRWYEPAWSGGSGWTGWEDLGGVLEGEPSATGEGDNGKVVRIDITAKGVDTPAGLWHVWYPDKPNEWSNWERLGDWPGAK